MGRIVVGVDGSENGDRALAWAAGEAKLRGSTLHLIHSWTLPPPMPLPAGEFSRLDLEGPAQQILDEAAAKVDAGLQAEPEITNDPASVALVRASEGAELLVVGSRGHGGFAGLLLGSVSQQCAHHARCPVVIIPPERKAKDSARAG